MTHDDTMPSPSALSAAAEALVDKDGNVDLGLALRVATLIDTERHRCARLLERVARRLRADPGLNLWSCAADEVDAAVDAIREGREP